MDILLKLFEKMDFQYWWPVDLEYHRKNNGDWRIEVIIGSVLTQNCRWTFVEKSIEILKKNKFVFKLENLDKIDENMIKVPFKKRKINTLKEIKEKFSEYEYKNIFNLNVEELRDILLSIKGIGNETADTIILYAFEKPSFIIDSYTRRLLEYEDKNISKLSYIKLKENIEKYVENNYNKFEEILFKKEINKEICYKYNYDNIPINPCIRDKINREKRLVLIYKELHAMIDIFMKNAPAGIRTPDLLDRCQEC